MKNITAFFYFIYDFQ